MTTNHSPRNPRAVRPRLLLAINLLTTSTGSFWPRLNRISRDVFAPNDPNAMLRTGTLLRHFLHLHDRGAEPRLSRRSILALANRGVCVILWSFARTSGSPHRLPRVHHAIFVASARAATGPPRPQFVGLFSASDAGRIMAFFAAPSRSAARSDTFSRIIITARVARAFYLVAIPGIILGSPVLAKGSATANCTRLAKRQRGARNEITSHCSESFFRDQLSRATAMTLRSAIGFLDVSLSDFRNNRPSLHADLGGITVVADCSRLCSRLPRRSTAKTLQRFYYGFRLGMLLAFRFASPCSMCHSRSLGVSLWLCFFCLPEHRTVERRVG